MERNADTIVVVVLETRAIDGSVRKSQHQPTTQHATRVKNEATTQPTRPTLSFESSEHRFLRRNLVAGRRCHLESGNTGYTATYSKEFCHPVSSTFQVDYALRLLRPHRFAILGPGL